MNRTISRLGFSSRVKTMLTIAIMSISSVTITETVARVYSAEKVCTTDTITNNNDSVADQLQILKDSVEQIKINLISEVDDYINSVAPKSKMSAEHIVNQCIENEFDITLLLSQGHLETHFATCGSNNCFGIGKKRYNHPDLAVIDYIDLMKKRYIINRTTEELLAANVNMENSRKTHYSTSSTYGSRVSDIRNNIIKTTNIDGLFNDLLEINQFLNQES